MFYYCLVCKKYYHLYNVKDTVMGQNTFRCTVDNSVVKEVLAEEVPADIVSDYDSITYSFESNPTANNPNFWNE